MQNKIFYLSCFGFVLGILFRSFIFVDFYFIVFSGLLLLFFVFFSYFIFKNKNIFLCFLFFFTLSLGIFRFHLRDIDNFKSVYNLSANIGKELEFKGIIIDDPVFGDKNTKLVIKLSEYKNTNILVSSFSNFDFSYGDEVIIKGKLQKIENFITDNGKEFDYINYLKKDKIFFQILFADVKFLSGENGNTIKSFLFKIKNKFLDNLNYAIPLPESSLMGGLVLGDKANFSKQEKEAFIKTGTIHIIALSGYNVSIVAFGIMKFFSFLPFVLNIFFGIFSIAIFVLMTGASSTAIRAGIMAILILFAKLLGRNHDILRILVIVFVIMIIGNPLILVYDVSFQLSFLATVGIIFFTPKIYKYFSKITESFSLREIIASTVSVYIFVLPFILYKMGNFSLVALPANILILPFIPLTMFFGFLIILFSLISKIFILPFGYLAYLLLHYEFLVINFFSSLSFSSFVILDFPLWLTLVIYLCFFYLLFGKLIISSFKNPI